MQTLPIDELSKELGNPSIQKILMFLSIYESLSVSRLMELTELSESQLHLILTRMIKVNLLEKTSRGIYALSDEKFVAKLKEAYKSIIISNVSTQIDEIQSLLEENAYEKALTNFKELARKYEPILQTHFLFKMNALSHDFMDRQKG